MITIHARRLASPTTSRYVRAPMLQASPARGFHCTRLAGFSTKPRDAAESSYDQARALARKGMTIFFVDGSWRNKIIPASASVDKSVRLPLPPKESGHPSWSYKSQYAEFQAIKHAVASIRPTDKNVIINTDSKMLHDVLTSKATFKLGGKHDKPGREQFEADVNKLRKEVAERNVKIAKVTSKKDIGNRKAHDLAAKAHPKGGKGGKGGE
ncbi:hypothetical protein GGF32_009574 [Allomyces javanicus]|nr:hypothetical protein GGF32_009574 [Allomyces javanicus]